MSANADPATVAAFDQILAIVCRELGVDFACAHAHRSRPTRSANAAWLHASDARRIAAYLLRIVGDVHGAEVARAMGVNRAAITISCVLVEDAREDLKFDALLDRLEKRVAPIFEVEVAHGDRT